MRPEAAKTFRTANPVDYRTALARRWEEKEAQLTRAQVRYWLDELWATGSGSLPRRSLAKLGPAWPAAAAWLGQVQVPGRPAALASLDEALNPSVPKPALLAELTRPGAGDPDRLLAVRLRLARNELEPALALVDAFLAEHEAGPALTFEAPMAQEAAASEGDEAPAPTMDYGSDAWVDRLETWLTPFKAAGKAKPVEERFLKLLARDRRQGNTSAQAWRLAFRLAPAADVPALGQELEEAWYRGEVPPNALGTILETAAPALPEAAPRWLSRWPDLHTYRHARERAAILEKLRQNGPAAQVLQAGRAKDVWSAQEDALAFDAWRRLGAADPKAPEAWTGAAAVWSGAVSLGDRLKAHPHDVNAARAAVRNPGPGEEGALTRALLVLENDRSWARDLDGDRDVLRLRVARGLLATSPLAARNALDKPEPAALARLLTDRKFKTGDINAALADLARIAARGGQDPKALFAVLADRGAPGLKALQAELAPAAGRMEAFRLQDGKPVPIRPRDLTWTLLATVLNKEGVL
jgi:hypothetical protein